jgi:hypothetical protein
MLKKAKKYSGPRPVASNRGPFDLQSDALPLSYDNLKLLRASSQLEWRCFIRKSMLAKRRENTVWQGSFDLV